MTLNNNAFHLVMKSAEMMELGRGEEFVDLEGAIKNGR
jgi:hypothetical protein